MGLSRIEGTRLVRSRPGILRRKRPADFLVAVLLLLQWSSAYGHCRMLEAAAHGLHGLVPICEAHSDQKAPDDPQKARASLDCPACHVAPALSPTPPAVPPLAVVWRYVDRRPPSAGSPVAIPRAPPWARGPPTGLRHLA